MKFEVRYKVFYVILFVVLSYVVLLGYLIAHENAHEQIGYNHNCIDSTINLNYHSLSGNWTCNEYENRSYDMYLQEAYLHSMNEIISYQLYFIIIMMIVLFYLSVIK